MTKLLWATHLRQLFISEATPLGTKKPGRNLLADSRFLTEPFQPRHINALPLANGRREMPTNKHSGPSGRCGLWKGLVTKNLPFFLIPVGSARSAVDAFFLQVCDLYRGPLMMAKPSALWSNFFKPPRSAGFSQIPSPSCFHQAPRLGYCLS